MDEEKAIEADAGGIEEDDTEGWQYVEIPDLEDAGFRFRIHDNGEVEVEVQHTSEIDEVPATWYARGFLECYLDMMGSIQAAFTGEGNPD